MPEDDNQDLLQEYRGRHLRWSDKTLSQVSFYNNLLLTVGIGFLSFTFQDSKIVDLEFRLKDIDYSITSYVLSLYAVTFSILTGFLSSISRLYDFRITSQVNLIRQRVLEHSHRKLSEKTPNEVSWVRKMFLPISVFLTGVPKITLEQCKAWQGDTNNLNERFSRLRGLSFNLGLATWSYLKWQTFLFAVAIVLYVASVLLS
jgi:hypothetical protein